MTEQTANDEIDERERYRLTLEALADVDAGHVIGHDEVCAWAASLDTGDPLPVPLE